MKTFVFDDRNVLPSYFCLFLDSLSVHTHVNLITSARLILSCNGQVELLQTCKSITVTDPRFITNYSFVVNSFDSHFTNYSTGCFAFERACFLRWFAINLATADLDDSEYICVVDSDFVLGCSPDIILQTAQQQVKSHPIEFIATWSHENSNIINPQVTIITKKLLLSFCRYIFSDYFALSCQSQRLGEWFDTIGRGYPGGVCDMSALGSWLLAIKPNKFNLIDLEKFYLISNFNNFLAKQSTDNIRWMLAFSSHTQLLSADTVKVNVLGTHFQGSAKRWISHWRLSSSKTMYLSPDTPLQDLSRPLFFLRILIKILLWTESFAPVFHSTLLKKFSPLGDSNVRTQ